MFRVWREPLIAVPVLLLPPVDALVAQHERCNVVACFQNDGTGAQLAEVNGVMQCLIAREHAAGALRMHKFLDDARALLLLFLCDECIRQI